MLVVFFPTNPTSSAWFDGDFRFSFLDPGSWTVVPAHSPRWRQFCGRTIWPVRIIGLYSWPTGCPRCSTSLLLETLAVLTSKGTCISHASSHQGVTRQKIIFFCEALDLTQHWLWTSIPIIGSSIESKARSETSDPNFTTKAWDINTAESTGCGYDGYE